MSAAGGAMVSPLVLHLADGRLAVIADPASVTLYAAVNGAAPAHGSAPVRRVTRKAPRAAKVKREKPAKAAKKAAKAARLSGDERERLKTRAFELHKEGLNPAQIHQRMQKEGLTVRYATIWGWLQ